MRSHFSHEINFVKYRKVLFAISAILVALSIVGIIARGINLGVEFRGGTQVSFNDAASVTTQQMRDAFADAGYSDATVQTTETAGVAGYLVGTSETNPTEASSVATQVASDLGLAEDSYTVTTIGPNWGSDVTRSMLVAFLAVIVLIVAFVSWRYELKMSLMAVVSLLHVLLIVAGVYAWTRFEVTPNVVAAVLTIMGFVLYDTVVVFNRVNENIRTYRDATHRTALQITNLAENQVVIRSINTTLTSLMPVIAMVIFGGDTLKSFALAMLVGLSLGAYSSIALAAPLYAMWKGREPEWRRAEELYGEKALARAAAAGLTVSELHKLDQESAPASTQPGVHATSQGISAPKQARTSVSGQTGSGGTTQAPKAKARRKSKNSGKVR